MSKERYELQKSIDFKNGQIDSLRNEIIELVRQSLLLCDDKQWYKEETETFGRGKAKRNKLVGRIYWDEYFEHSDSTKSIKITRSKIVRVDGEWV